MARGRTGSEGRQWAETVWGRAVVVGVLLLSLFAALKNLGNQYLWQDEAQTAVIAKTVLARGVPYGTDGRNFFSQEMGAEYGPGYLWRWHTWLPFYLVAASFRLFGVGTFAARLPFALLGCASVLIVFLAAKELYKDQRTALVCAFMLATSIPFIILSRQCRYYSAAAFCTLVVLYAYVRTCERKKGGSILLGTALVLLFHTHYVYFAASVAALLGHALCVRRQSARTVMLAAATAAVICLPWMLWLAGGGYAGRYAERILSPGSFMTSAVQYIVLLGAHVAPLAVLVAPLSVPLVRAVRKSRPMAGSGRFWCRASLLLLFICIPVIALAAFAPAPFFRYLAPVIPVFVMLLGVAVERTREVHRVVPWLLLIAYVAFQPLPGFAYELFHDYDGPVEGLVRFLSENAAPDDTVAITYGDMPLKFYTDLRVIGGLTGEPLTGATGARWVVIRHHTVSDKDYEVYRFLSGSLSFDHYERIVLAYPDCPFENRESPSEHRFRTAAGFPPLVILRRSDGVAASPDGNGATGTIPPASP
jgi:hypothetical protein